MEVLKRDGSIDYAKLLQRKWIPRALVFWLTHSWQFPYGLTNSTGKTPILPEDKIEEWEDFSLSALLRLISQWNVGDLTEEEIQQNGHQELKEIVGFLNMPAIRKVASGKEEEVPQKEWDALVGIFKEEEEELALSIA